MIDEDRRKEIYNSAFQFMIENNISSIPVWTEDICQKLNIELIRMTDIIRDTNLQKEDIFKIWGNEDGVMQAYGEICKIAYNNTMPIHRQRFTIMEEVAHKLLKHINNERFNIFNQSYDDKIYKRYDEEARMWAGLVLCPPQYFYSYEKEMTQNLFKNLYKVSSSCAKVRIDVLCKFESEIKECSLYKSLPKIKIDYYYIKRVFA